METLDARAAALAAGYSKRHAKAVGESLSDILQGLERDILRILTRTLITEPIAAGIRGGIAGEESGAGGLEGVLNKVFGTAGGFFGEAEPTITRVDSEIADQATTSLLALGTAGDTAGGALRGTLSEGALKAGVETLTQAGASTVATTQLTDLAAAGTAAAALKTLAALSGTPGGAGGGGSLSPDQVLSIFGPGPHAGGGGPATAGAGTLTDAQALSIFGPGPHAGGSAGAAGGGATAGGPASGAGFASLAGPGIFAAAAVLTAVLLSKSLPLLNDQGSHFFKDIGDQLTSGFGIPSLFGFAGGGPVSGPGGPRSDSIPALLSDGEFVVNADMARRHRRLLEAVNKGNRLFGMDIFRDGGLATTGVPDIPPPIRRGPAPGDSALGLRPIVNNFFGVTDQGSFQRNGPQFRGQLRELMSRAEKRDD